MDTQQTEHGLVHRFVAHGAPEDVVVLDAALRSESPSPGVAAFLDGGIAGIVRTGHTTVSAVVSHHEADVARIERLAAEFPALTFDALVMTHDRTHTTLSATFEDGRNTYMWQESSPDHALVPPPRARVGGRS